MEAPPVGFSIMSDGTVMMGEDCPTLSPMMLALMAAVQTKILQKDDEKRQASQKDSSMSEDEESETEGGDKGKNKPDSTTLNEPASSSSGRLNLGPNFFDMPMDAPSKETNNIETPKNETSKAQKKKKQMKKRGKKANFYKKK